MFRKLLIANRGEIACRVMRTARRLGIGTVAVYSDADRDALHVSLADEAVRIGPAPAGESYLLIERIVEACRATGAEAVHPGYGFLSERAAFAEALAAAGIVFVGPNAQAIAAMGDKIESKRRAAAAGVSTVPGYLGVIEDAAHATRIADAIGYPVMLKASAGGGGKGMRIAWSASEVAEGFERSRSEAASSFGDDRMFVEKFIENPRHVEIQVLGDKHGHVIHLGERECSVQRRNQKVVEEAPSPLLDEATRQAMGAQAVALARAVSYDSAGTVEFVAGQDRSFFFLEMNTRLQVEHPVTEMVTGVDLVEQMIRVAAGERLSIRQEDVTLRGWAVESRIYAEDPARGFLPSVGRLVTYRPPREGQQEGEAPSEGGSAVVRVDTGVEEGGEIPIHYDPMIAKLVTHAPTRLQAIEAQADALDAFAIEGIRHNIPFLAALMAQARWREGRLSTGYIAEEFAEGFAPPRPAGAVARRMAAVAAAIDHRLNNRKRAISGQLRTGRPVAFAPERVVMLDAEAHALTILGERDGTLLLRFQDEPQPEPQSEPRSEPRSEPEPVAVASSWRPGEPVWRGRIDGEAVAAQVRPIMNGVRLAHRGAEAEARVYTRREAALAALMPAKPAASASKALLCPMPGLVKTIAVAEGQAVKAGETLAIVEAMKMENVLRAERDATVERIHAKEGDTLAVDATIISFA
jgi:propionyl-CoA carboxylase alpha chain